MSALSAAASQQGPYGASGDTCFSGGFLCGVQRFDVLRKTATDLTIEPNTVRKSDATYQFGGSKSEVYSSWTIQLNSSPKYVIDIVDGPASGLPLLFGIKIMRSVLGNIGFTGETLKITFGARSVNVWEAGGLPTCDIRDVIAAGETNLVLRTIQGEAVEDGVGDNMINPDVVVVEEESNGPVGEAHHERPVGESVVVEPLVDVDKPSIVELGEKLSLVRVEKTHSQSHANVDRLYGTFMSAFPSLSNEDRMLVKSWCVYAVKTCPECAKFGPRITAGTVLRGALLKNERGHIDLLSLDQARDIYALAIVDEGTRDFAMGIVSTRQSEDVFRCYVLSWAVHHGCHRYLFSDGDGCFASKKFIDLCISFGIIKDAGPGEASESFGIVERSIATARLSTDRVFADPNGPRNKEEWALSVALIANGIRNEIRSTASGSTASERSIGSNSSIFSNFLAELEISGHSGCQKTRLQQIKDISAREFHGAINSEKLRLMGKERVTRARNVLVGSYELGERVEFFRNADARGATWHTGKIVGIMPTSDRVSVEYFHVDESGALQRVAARHVRKSGIEPVVELDWTFKPRTSKPEEGTVPPKNNDNVHQLLKPSVATDSQPAVEPDAPDVALPALRHLNASHPAHTLQSKDANDVNDDGVTCSGHGSDYSEPDSDFESDLVTLICSGGEYAGGSLHLGGVRDAANAKRKNERKRLSKRVKRKMRRVENVAIIAEKEKGETVENGETEEKEKKKTNVLGTLQKDIVSGLTSMDAYSYSFEDLSPAEQEKSMLKAIADYDEFLAWDRGSDKTESEIEAHLQANPTAVKIACAFIHKAKISGGKLIGKSRLTPRGFLDKFRFSEETQSPTVSAICLRIILIWALRMNFITFQLDFSQAFFQSEVILEREIWIEVPEIDRKGPEKTFRLLKKSVPGTNSAPRHWYDTFKRWIVSIGFVVSRYDPAVFLYGTIRGAVHVWSIIIPLHVDDGRGGGEPAAVRWFQTICDQAYGGRWKIGEWLEPKIGETTEFIGTEMKLVLRDGEKGLEVSQGKYVEAKLKICDENTESAYRSSLGGGLWATCHSQSVHAYDVALAAQKANDVTPEAVRELNLAIEGMKSDPLTTFIPTLDRTKEIDILLIDDAGMGDSGSWVGGQGGTLLGLGEKNGSSKFATVYVKSGKFRRTAGSSFDGECIIVHDSLKTAIFVQGFLGELQNGKLRQGLKANLEQTLDGVAADVGQKADIHVFTDSDSVVRKVRASFNTADVNKRRVEDIADIRECMSEDAVKIHHINGITNPTDALTKHFSKCTSTRKLLKQLLESGIYVPDLSTVYLGRRAKPPPKKRK